MKIHPVAGLFPLLEGAEFDRLVESIRTNGLIESIKTWHGEIIDGRNRDRACDAASVVPHYEAMDRKLHDQLDVVRYIVAANIDRRHLTPGQIATLGEVLRPQWEAAAKVRQEQAGKRGKEGGRGRTKNPGPEKRARVSREGRVDHQLAAVLGISPDSIAKAHKLAQEAPELVAKVRTGEVTLNAAHRMHIESVRSQRTPEQKTVRRQRVVEVVEQNMVAAREHTTEGALFDLNAGVHTDLACAIVAKVEYRRVRMLMSALRDMLLDWEREEVGDECHCFTAYAGDDYFYTLWLMDKQPGAEVRYRIAFDRDDGEDAETIAENLPLNEAMETADRHHLARTSKEWKRSAEHWESQHGAKHTNKETKT